MIVTLGVTLLSFSSSIVHCLFVKGAPHAHTRGYLTSLLIDLLSRSVKTNQHAYFYSHLHLVERSAEFNKARIVPALKSNVPSRRSETELLDSQIDHIRGHS